MSDSLNHLIVGLTEEFLKSVNTKMNREPFSCHLRDGQTEVSGLLISNNGLRDIENTFELGTLAIDCEGIQAWKIEKPKELKSRVFIRSCGNARGRARIKKILCEFADLNDIAIVLRNVRDKTQPAFGGTKGKILNIYTYSAPLDARAVAFEGNCQEMWGHLVANHDSFYPVSEGLTIRSPEGASVACLINEKHLFIYHNIFAEGVASVGHIFREILSAAFGLMGMSADAYNTYVLESYATPFFNQEKAKVEQGLTNCRTKIAEYHNSFLEEMKREQVFISRAATLLDSTKSAIKTLKAELDIIRGFPLIKEATIFSGGIKVQTDLITCTDPRTNRVYDIGEFDMQIPFSGDLDAFRFFNKTNKLERGFSDREQHAPHVLSGAAPCWGNTREVFPDLFLGFQYSIIVSVCLQFLGSVNVSDVAGRAITKFPESKTQNNTEEVVVDATENVD